MDETRWRLDGSVAGRQYRRTPSGVNPAWLEPTNQLRVAGTLNLAESAVEAHTRLLVSQSVAFVYRWDGDARMAVRLCRTRHQASRHIPRWLARLVSNRFVADSAVQLRGAWNRKARDEFGWEPRWTSWRQGFSDALG